MAFGARKEEGHPQISTTQSVFSKDLMVKGDVVCNGLLRIEGHVEGTVKGDGEVTVAEHSEVVGDVEGRKIIVLGAVRGNITARESVEVVASAEVNGDITTEKLSIEEGAVFNGKCITKVKEEHKLEEPKKEEKKIV